MVLQSVDPFTGEILQEYPVVRPDEVASILSVVHGATAEWYHTSFADRAVLMKRAGAILRDGADTYARLMAHEMGKPLAQGKAEAEKCAWVCDYYAQNAEGFLSSEEVATDASSSYVAFRPLGVILAVMPWNFPFWQVLRFAAPALMAGNGAVLKHASNVSGCAFAIEEIFRSAGFPPDLFRTLALPSAGVETVIRSPVIRAVTLTGSGSAGRAVASIAGQELKKTVLELGGSDPYVVLEDADLERTVEACVASRLINAGQSCIAAKRFIAVEDVYEEFLERMVDGMERATVGNPLEPATEVGPLARLDLRDELHQQVTQSLDRGAKLMTGGSPPDGPGAFYPPTVLAGVQPGMPAYDEELFGPVAAMIRVRDEHDAIRVANDSPLGLGAAVFTHDVERGERIARDGLEAGACFVNAFVRSDPRLPFGGVKASGYGRELSSFGIREFVNVKTVWVK